MTRWLMGKGRIDEAEAILADLETTDVYDPWIVTQSKEIQVGHPFVQQHRTSLTDPTIVCRQLRERTRTEME